MKKVIVVIVCSIFLQPILLINNLLAQNQDAGDIANATVDRLADALDFEGQCWSEKYLVTNHQIVYFDLNLKTMEAILYFRFHPINKFKLNMLDFESNNISISDRYIEIVSNNGEDIQVEPNSKKMLLKSNDKIIEIDIELVSTLNQNQRIVLNDIDEFYVVLNNCNSEEKQVADFYLYNSKIMSLKLSKYLNSNIVWEIDGNLGSTMYLNTARGTLYYKNVSPKGTWANIKKIQP